MSVPNLAHIDGIPSELADPIARHQLTLLERLKIRILVRPNRLRALFLNFLLPLPIHCLKMQSPSKVGITMIRPPPLNCVWSTNPTNGLQPHERTSDESVDKSSTPKAAPDIHRFGPIDSSVGTDARVLLQTVRTKEEQETTSKVMVLIKVSDERFQEIRLEARTVTEIDNIEAFPA